MGEEIAKDLTKSYATTLLPRNPLAGILVTREIALMLHAINTASVTEGIEPKKSFHLYHR